MCLLVLFFFFFFVFSVCFFFFFQAEDGIRDHCVTGVQTCALPILLGTLNTTIASAMMATVTHAMRANRSQCPRRVVVGGEARGLISLIPRTGEDERRPGRVGKAKRHPDARLTCRTPDYCSHSFRAGWSLSLSHHHSGRASAKRYEERYDREFLETT